MTYLAIAAAIAGVYAILAALPSSWADWDGFDTLGLDIPEDEDEL